MDEHSYHHFYFSLDIWIVGFRRLSSWGFAFRFEFKNRRLSKYRKDKADVSSVLKSLQLLLPTCFVRIYVTLVRLTRIFTAENLKPKGDRVSVEQVFNIFVQEA